jgi:hypothetical protein
MFFSGKSKIFFVVDIPYNSEKIGDNYHVHSGSSSAKHELRELKTFFTKESPLIYRPPSPLQVSN